MGPDERHKVCVELDELLLEFLELVQRRIECQVETERRLAKGCVHLAKARYVTGQNSVSRLQLPTEESPPFEALATVVRDEDGDVQLKHREPEGREDPMYRFGVLVPRDLRHGRDEFKAALELTTESVNICKRLGDVQESVLRLRSAKARLEPEE